MYCKECGHELQNDSKFCSNCGTEIISDKTIDKIDADKKFPVNAIIFGTVITLLICSIIVAFFLIIKADSNKESGFYIGIGDQFINAIEDIFDKETTPIKAKTTDITIDFYLETPYDSVEKYYAILQANEKIENLVIEIDFLDKNKDIVKTERIEIGKVVPGNEYKIELNQNGIAFDRLDKTTQFRTRVIEGTIIE